MDSSGSNGWTEEEAGLASSTEVSAVAIPHDTATSAADSTPVAGLSSAEVAGSKSATEDSSNLPPSTSNYRKGILDHATEFINDHIRAFRQLPWIIGGVGVVLLVRFYPRLTFRRYRQPSNIPQQLIENNVKLMGIVAMTGWNSVGVWHVPLLRRVLRLKDQPIDRYSEEELLNVRFAGVAIGNPEDSERWLEDTLLGKRVWFTLLDHTPDKKALSCIVYAKGKSWLKIRGTWCVNEQLLAKGFGSIDEVTGFKRHKDYTNFIHRLGRREMTAKRTGAGLWKGSEYVSWWRRLTRMLRLSS